MATTTQPAQPSTGKRRFVQVRLSGSNGTMTDGDYTFDTYTEDADGNLVALGTVTGTLSGVGAGSSRLTLAFALADLFDGYNGDQGILMSSLSTDAITWGRTNTAVQNLRVSADGLSYNIAAGYRGASTSRIWDGNTQCGGTPVFVSNTVNPTADCSEFSATMTPTATAATFGTARSGDTPFTPGKNARFIDPTSVENYQGAAVFGVDDTIEVRTASYSGTDTASVSQGAALTFTFGGHVTPNRALNLWWVD